MSYPRLRRLSLCIGLLLAVLSAAPALADRVFILAQNEGTEITDLLVPFAVLSEAGVDVEIVATDRGPVSLWPSLQLKDLRTLAEVDLTDAAWIVVPAVQNPDDPQLQETIRAAAAGGTAIGSICDGVTVLAAAGILEGREATGHFYSARKRASNFPNVNWRDDRRYVFDDNVLTSAGVSASAPAAVELVRRIKGQAAAARVADYFGIDADETHNAAAFRFGLRDGWTAIRNRLAGSRSYEIAAEPAIDEYSLAFLVDVLGRTNRAKVIIQPESKFTSLRGLRFQGTDGGAARRSIQVSVQPGATAKSTLYLGSPAESVKRVFQHVGETFGGDTARFIAKQLEMPVVECSL